MEPNENVFGPQVDDAISRDLFGEAGAGEGPPPPGGAAADPLRTMYAGLQIVERHLYPVTNANLGALALLQREGGQWAALADFWLENHVRRGGAGVLLDALEHMSLIKSYRGTSGSLFGGKRGVAPMSGVGGGRG